MAGKKVFLVDDDEDFVDVIQVTLESNGYEVATAHSGEEAREKIPDEKPDVIILDVMMETDDAGFKTARWLREQDETSDIPLVMLTAVNQQYPMQFNADDVWLPVDEFLEKPVDGEKLMNVIEKVSS